ncbi:MAG: SLBB domain-containing protein [Planctomycetota bacterium]
MLFPADYRTAVNCLLAAALLQLAAGCQSARYSAASLPADLRAVAATGGNEIHLPNLAAAATKSTAISPGDLLDVRVVSGLEEKVPEPQVAQVSPRGDIDLPLIGPVMIAGLQPPDASRAITAAAIERGVYRRPHVTLEVRRQATYQVTVLGAVAEPGVHELPIGACNVLAAIAAAGGLTDEAGTTVEVMRQPGATRLAGQPVQQASFRQPASGQAGPTLKTDGRATAEPGAAASTAAKPVSAVGAGKPIVERIDLAQASSQAAASGPLGTRHLGDRDVVMVTPRKQRVVHVTGLVHKPDQFELPVDQDVHLLDALAMAGGRTSPLADKVFVVRQRADGGQPAMIEASVAKAKRNGAENLILAPGDLVSVESTAATTAADIFQSFFRVSLGLTNTAFSL